MKCPYSDVCCEYLDIQAGELPEQCKACEHFMQNSSFAEGYEPADYDSKDKIRPTGATPIIGWIIDKIQSIKIFKNENNRQ